MQEAQEMVLFGPIPTLPPDLSLLYGNGAPRLSPGTPDLLPNSLLLPIL